MYDLYPNVSVQCVTTAVGHEACQTPGSNGGIAISLPLGTQGIEPMLV